MVRGDVLVAPVIELRDDGTFQAVLDLPNSELVGMVFEGFDGVDTDADTAAALGQMLFATIGGELFSGLARHMGLLGLDIDAESAAPFGLAGVAASVADVRVLDGEIVVGLPSVPGLDGHASPAPCGASGLGLGIADGALASVLTVVGALVLGVELPFDVEFVSDRRGIGGRVRNRRLITSSLVPDLRSGLRYTLAPRLVGEDVEISLREAWLELPFVPPMVNQFNRVLGGAAGLAPFASDCRRSTRCRRDRAVTRPCSSPCRASRGSTAASTLRSTPGSEGPLMFRSAIDSALEAIVPVAYTGPGFRIRQALWSWPELDAWSAADRTIVVTGATSGLGAELAMTLVDIEARVVLVGRNRERADRVRSDILAVHAGASVDIELADMSDLAAVRELAERLVDDGRSVDVLVHNAGAMAATRTETGDGLETTFATMVAGPHLLTSLLRQPLVGGRVVWMTSGGMYTQALHLDDLQYRDGNYRGAAAYARAKRAQCDLVAEWARRSPSIFSAAVHPGWADTPGVVDSLPRFHRVLGRVLRTPSQGIDTAAWLCVAPEPLVHNGALWFDRRMRSDARLPSTATSAAERRRLVEVVDDLVGVR